jgi:hypothetical protein
MLTVNSAALHWQRIRSYRSFSPHWVFLPGGTLIAELIEKP